MKKTLLLLLTSCSLLPILFIITIFMMLLHPNTGGAVLSLKGSMLLFLGFIVADICLLMAVLRLISHNLCAPLQQILRTIEAMSKGNYTKCYPEDQKDEFGAIANALNGLMDKIEQDKEELVLKEERYRIVSTQSSDIIFEYNIKDGTIYHHDNFEKRFRRVAPSRNFPEEMLVQGYIFEKDIANFRAWHQGILDKKERNEVEIRLLKADSTPLWCLLQATSLFDATGNPVRVVGRIVDINESKKEKEHLLSITQRDALTNLYNKMTTETLIKQCIEESHPGDKHALFAIDIDNFKAVNDNLGHLFGDEVLQKIAASTASVFRTSDIVGRIGGDEFVVLVKNYQTEAIIFERASELTTVFKRTYTGQHEDYKISGSIGIALWPNHGTSFNELFRRADSALYYAKNRGKDCYQMYGPEVDEEHYIIQMENRGRITHEKESISEYIFRVLYQASDIPSAVDLIMGIVGKYFNVSRAYVFENTADGTCCNNTFEWCNEGILPQQQNLQNVPYSLLGDYSSNFNDDGIFYCSDITKLRPALYEVLEPQGIQSLLQCHILNDGAFEGYVGFDACEENRLWTKEEIEALSFISKILSTFLVKLRTQNKLEQSYNRTKMVLDTQNLWSYVVDKNTYELLFINKKTHQLSASASIGQKCHEAFFAGRKTPCERCPMVGVSADNDSYTMEIYNETFNLWTIATASKMQWEEGREVLLLSCMDITRYRLPPVATGRLLSANLE